MVKSEFWLNARVLLAIQQCHFWSHWKWQHCVACKPPPPPTVSWRTVEYKCDKACQRFQLKSYQILWLPSARCKPWVPGFSLCQHDVASDKLHNGASTSATCFAFLQLGSVVGIKIIIWHYLWNNQEIPEDCLVAWNCSSSLASYAYFLGREPGDLPKVTQRGSSREVGNQTWLPRLESATLN